MYEPLFEAFRSQRKKARQRGIEFHLSFEEWCDWWKATGKSAQRGCRKGQYVMARLGDKGAYELSNIKCVPCSINVREGNLGATRSAETRANIAAARLGSKQKLNIEKARFIRSSNLSMRQLADQFSVSLQNIHHVIQNKIWKESE